MPHAENLSKPFSPLLRKHHQSADKRLTNALKTRDRLSGQQLFRLQWSSLDLNLISCLYLHTESFQYNSMKCTETDPNSPHEHGKRSSISANLSLHFVRALTNLIVNSSTDFFVYHISRVDFQTHRLKIIECLA